MIYLKASTASQEVLLGPFVDSTDGVTAETALTIANTDIKIFKAGATTLASKNSGGATHISGGNYYAVLDATDTDTVGSGTIVVQVSGALAVRHDFTVLPALVYDSLIAGSDNLQVDTIQAAGTTWGSGAITAGSIASSAITSAKFAAGAIDAAAIADNAIDLATFAADAKALMGVIAFGTAQSVTGTTIRLASAETFADDELIGATVLIRSASTGAGQARVITDYVSSTDTATVDTWTTTPTGTVTYVVFATSPASSSAPIAANVTQWNGSAVATPNTAGVPKVDTVAVSGTTQTARDLGASVIAASVTGNVGGNVVGSVGSVTGAVGSVTGNVGGNVTGSVGSVVGAVGSVTGNVGGNVVGSVASVTGLTASDVAAIKAKTDSLTFTVAGQVDANVQSINDVTINGTGVLGDEFAP